jgi:hypothetical protein
VLQDEFIEVHSECNALDALEGLMNEVERTGEGRHGRFAAMVV